MPLVLLSPISNQPASLQIIIRNSSTKTSAAVATMAPQKTPKPDRELGRAQGTTRRGSRRGACKAYRASKVRCVTLWGYQACVKCRDGGERCTRREIQSIRPQYGSVDDIFKNPTYSKTFLQKVQKKASSNSNSSFAIENGVPPWHPLYFIHSEVKRLLGPLNDESCLLEDDNLHNDQSPSEVKDENHYPLQGSPETCESNDSRPLTPVPTAQQQISSSPESNSSDEIDLTAHPLHMAYLQQDNSIPRDKSKSQSWETKIYSAWISPAELDVLFGS